MKSAALALAFGSCLAPVPACAPSPPATHPLPAYDAGPGQSSPCAQACERRRGLGCLEPELARVCVDVCERASAQGLYAPACVLAATSREELEACRVRCAPP